MAELEPQLAPAGSNKLVVARDFLVDTRAEMDKVSWPPKDELIQATKSVVLASLALGVVIGLADWVLQKILIDGLALLTR
ncbi:MAG TPA: preprotein translocase subunit SecE [Gemmatimonadales bacterium]|jgi:preprotein translocase SecE subunit